MRKQQRIKSNPLFRSPLISSRGGSAFGGKGGMGGLVVEKLAINGGIPVRKKPLPPEYPGGMVIGKEEKTEILEVIEAKSPYRYYGPHPLAKVKTFEREFAEKMGTRYALAVSSGTAALKVALAALGVGPGDEVIIPAVTFLACVGATVMSRAIPVFAEVDKSLTLDPDDFAAKITKRTKVVMPVHLQGVPCKMDEIITIAKRCGIKVLEDCAQSCGASYGGRKVGSIGNVGIFSLQFNKIITSGEGGVVVTNDTKIYERAVRAHDHGVIRPSTGQILGVYQKDAFISENYRMGEIAGAMARAQLRKLNQIITTLRSYKKQIKDAISDIKNVEFRQIPDEKGQVGFTIVFYLPNGEKAHKFIKALNAENIGAYQLYGGDPVYAYPQVLNQRTVTKDRCPFNCLFSSAKIKYRMGMCPKSEDLLSRSVWIPISILLTPNDIKDIIKAIRKVHYNLFYTRVSKKPLCHSERSVAK